MSPPACIFGLYMQLHAEAGLDAVFAVSRHPNAQQQSFGLVTYVFLFEISLRRYKTQGRCKQLRELLSLRLVQLFHRLELQLLLLFHLIVPLCLPCFKGVRSFLQLLDVF